MIRTAAATAVLVGTGALALAQQPPRPATPPPPSGTVSGMVLSTDTGQPLRKATVRVYSAAARVGRSAKTDAEGRFVLTRIQPGNYALSATQPGYMEMVYGARKPGPSMPGTEVRIAAGQTIENLELKLPRGGAITGTITDEFGDPAFGIPVRLMLYVYSNGGRFATTFGQQDITDDRGAYRIAGLLPGDYIVSAVPREDVGTAMRARDMQRERFGAALTSARAAGDATPLGMRADALEQLNEPIDPRGYVPVHYPGTVHPGTATSVPVGPGAEVNGIDIRLQVVHTATVTGTVTSTEGAVPSGARVQLLDPTTAMPTVGSWWTGLLPGSKFVFYGVAPGAYLLRVHTSISGTDLYSFEEVQVVAGRPNDVELRLQRGMTVAGVVSLEGAPVPLSRLRVVLMPVVSVADPELGPERVALDAEGRFAFRGLIPARYRFAMEGLPAGWSIGSAMFGARDLADYNVVIESGRNLTGGILKLTSRLGEIAGAVTNASAQPVTSGVVLVFPEDPQLWVVQSRRIHNASLSTDGRYAVRGLPAGDYRVAIADPEPHQWFDRDYLNQLLAASVRVTLIEGEKKQQDLRLR